METLLPLAGIRCVEYASDAAAAYAGRLLAAMGAEVIMIEPTDGSPLRREPPFIGSDKSQSALFAYLAAGKQSVVCDLESDRGEADFANLVGEAHILITDVPYSQRPSMGLDEAKITVSHPHLVYLSVLPFGSYGPKTDWLGTELNLIHASGEGFLLPNGLSATLFPERPPLKIAGHFAEMQGGIAAALSALAAILSGRGQYVDVSVQDANLAVGAFTVQRYGDGSLEHRLSRSFRYGGVIECADGYVELLTLEQRQWHALVELMDYPAWAVDVALDDPAERSTRGDMLNMEIREWARTRPVDELVAHAQKLGVPMARYNSPEQILAGRHEAVRGIFAPIPIDDSCDGKIQSAPFRFSDQPLPSKAWPGEVGKHFDEAVPSVGTSSRRQPA